jgi:aldehyde:ferredoxin oxidoreductase
MGLKGFFNRILFIDLTSESFKEEITPHNITTTLLGGKGLGSFLLLRYNPPRVDPLSPQNCIIFTTGLGTDTPLPGSSRYGVYTKSPQTGIYSESYSGGRIAQAFSRTGYDAVVISGASEQPIFLEISEGGARIHPARQFWGMETYQAEDSLKKAICQKKAEALVIGPAGENRVKFAILATDYWRSAGRTGVGAILGAKKVKGIIFHGKKRRPVSQEHQLRAFKKEILARVRKDPKAKSLREFGSSGLVSIMNTIGGFPTRYWSKGRLDGWEEISAESLLRHCHVESRSCPICSLKCAKTSTVKHGKYQGLRVGGPDYQTINAFGGLCMIRSIEEIIYLNDLCDRLGIDTITAGNLCAFAIEASLRGIITENLEYGNAESIAKLLSKIAYKEGVGMDLAEGINLVAKKWGLEELAVQVKGLEPPGYDPRALRGMGLAYAMADRGACHSRSGLYIAELRGEISAEKTEGKVKELIDYEDRLTIFDSIILCRFYSDFIGWKELEMIINLITGESFQERQLKQIAQTTANLVRRYNIQEGVSKRDDYLPKRFFKETLADGKGIYTEEEFCKMIDEYYKERGWDPKGNPPQVA